MAPGADQSPVIWLVCLFALTVTRVVINVQLQLDEHRCRSRIVIVLPADNNNRDTPTLTRERTAIPFVRGESLIGVIAVEFRAVERESCIAERLALIGRVIGPTLLSDPLYHNPGSDNFETNCSPSFWWDFSKKNGECERNGKIEEKGKQLKRGNKKQEWNDRKWETREGRERRRIRDNSRMIMQMDR